MEKKAYEGKKIFIQRWNNGERNFKHEHTIFDMYALGDVYTDMCETPAEVYAIRKQIEDGIKQQHGQDLSDKETDITYITININDVDNEVDKLGQEILDMVDKGVGGDDDSYDYFPDIVYAFNQICENLGTMNKYSKLAAKLNVLLEYEKDDECYIE